MQETRTLELCHEVCSEKRGVSPEVLLEVIILAVELAREGREGRKVGALFVVGDHDAVLSRSRELILDPLLGHPDVSKRVKDPNVRETLKELAQLDGAFVISDAGVAVSACRYIEADAREVRLPLGLGSRHMAAAAISKHTGAVAVVVSESSLVRVFDDGELISEIIPEVWMLSRYSVHLNGPYAMRAGDNLTVLSKVE